jgi:hypothetical protein
MTMAVLLDGDTRKISDIADAVKYFTHDAADYPFEFGQAPSDYQRLERTGKRVHASPVR